MKKLAFWFVLLALIGSVILFFRAAPTILKFAFYAGLCCLAWVLYNARPKTPPKDFNKPGAF